MLQKQHNIDFIAVCKIDITEVQITENKHPRICMNIWRSTKNSNNKRRNCRITSKKNHTKNITKDHTFPANRNILVGPR